METEVVKRALRSLTSDAAGPAPGAGIFERTTLEVVSEVVYFLDLSAPAQADFLERLDEGYLSGLVQIAALDPADPPNLAAQVSKYADRPIDLADASLVWLASKTGITEVITVDRGEFAVYRTVKRKAFRNVFRA